ncbi:acetyl-CoA carboxylase biotin carboxyl carrier protein subunit [Candidatus Bathyarchaeota archaeon]|nr:MAG: acetyl-CoA carboxylase biotin carboxyl carrier protein subunit [Candidatus Bathyarchaeota archaeon]
MPVYNIKVGEKEFKIELKKISEDTFTVKVGDKTHEVKLAKDNLSKNVFSINVNGKEYGIKVEKVSRKAPFTLVVDDIDFKVQLIQPERRVSYAPTMPVGLTLPTQRGKAIAEKVKGAVRAPMTGKIVSVKVNEGDEVKEDQVLCILEAMKMENEISAPKSGKVKEIRVSEGSAVNEGDILLIIE